jgi:GTP-binding protein
MPPKKKAAPKDRTSASASSGERRAKSPKQTRSGARTSGAASPAALRPPAQPQEDAPAPSTRTPSNLFRGARFVLSAPEPKHLPPDAGTEIAFAGRSNAGKSSALNALCEQTGLARTSKTPGRTQALVVFELDAGKRLIDLPGYGYAKVPEAMRAHWRKAIDRYLRERQSLRGVVLIVDSRHPLKEFDQLMLGYCRDVDLPCHILLSKADKLSRGEAARTLAQVRKALKDEGFQASAQLFSALAKQGIDEARNVLADLLAAPRN